MEKQQPYWLFSGCPFFFFVHFASEEVETFLAKEDLVKYMFFVSS